MTDLFKKVNDLLSYDTNLGVYLFENKGTKNKPYVIYKMLFDDRVKQKLINNLNNAIDEFRETINDMENEEVPYYNPDADQEIFQVNKDNIEIFSHILPYLTEENNPLILSNNIRIDEKNKIKAWIIKVEYEEDNRTKQIYFFQKFLKSQFMQSKKMFFLLDNNEFKLLDKEILGMSGLFEVVLIEDKLISRNIKTFEYIFDFVRYYKKESNDFVEVLKEEKLFEINNEAEEKLKKKIESSKRFAHKFYTAKKNGYYKSIDINKLERLISEQSLNLNVNDNKIIIDNETNMDTLVKVLNDDYEQSLITTNKYIAQKKQKI